jgi:hypothetical protein
VGALSDERSSLSPVRLGVGPPSAAHDQMFITVGHLLSSWHGAPSLMRGRRARNLLVQFVVALRAKPRRTHSHILLSHLRLLVSLFVASYNSLGYGGGILTRLHTARPLLTLRSAKCWGPSCVASERIS